MTLGAKALLALLALGVGALAWTGHHLALGLRYQVVSADSGYVLDTWRREICSVQACVPIADRSMSADELRKWRSIGVEILGDTAVLPPGRAPQLMVTPPPTTPPTSRALRPR